MKLYEFFSVENADFLNLELLRDSKIFIDPFLLSIEDDKFSKVATQNIRNYFEMLLQAIIRKDESMLNSLIENLHERNETRIGYSKNRPRGIGFAGNSGEQLVANVKRSQAMKTGLISDIFDCSIMVDKVGQDKISDLITNIILLQLIEYTQEQCNKYHIPMRNVLLKNNIWNYKSFRYEKRYAFLPVDIDKQPIIFLPKKITTLSMFYTYRRVYNDLMLPYYEELELRDPSSGLVYILKSTGEKKVSKKKLKSKYPCTKAEVTKFVDNNYELYNAYKTNKFTYVKRKDI